MTQHADPVETGLSRRSFIGGGAAATLSTRVGLAGPSLGPGAPSTAAPNGAAGGFDGYGPLQPDPAGRLTLPERTSTIGRRQSGVTRLEGGRADPDNLDGAASFVRPGGDGGILITNHEIRARTASHGVPQSRGFVYDPGVHGGTTTIVVDKHSHRVREYVSLAGHQHELRRRQDALAHLADL